MRKCIDVEIGTTGRSEALFTADAGWSGHGCYSPETEREVCLLTHIITPALFPLLFPNSQPRYPIWCPVFLPRYSFLKQFSNANEPRPIFQIKIFCLIWWFLQQIFVCKVNFIFYLFIVLIIVH